VFFITGLWHGSSWTYVIWGIAHGLFIILEKLGLKKILNRLGSGFSMIYAFLVVNLLWPLFRCSSLSEALLYLKTMFNFKASTNFDYLNFYLTKEVFFILIIATILSTPIYRIINDFINNLNTNTNQYKILLSLKTVALFMLFIINYFYIASEAYNPFIYFRF